MRTRANSQTHCFCLRARRRQKSLAAQETEAQQVAFKIKVSFKNSLFPLPNGSLFGVLLCVRCTASSWNYLFTSSFWIG